MSDADWNDVVQHIKPYFSAVAVVAAMQLDIFTALADKSKTSEELAAAVGVPPPEGVHVGYRSMPSAGGLS